MPGVVAGIIAAIVGTVVAVGGGVALAQSQGPTYPAPASDTGSITVYGNQ